MKPSGRWSRIKWINFSSSLADNPDDPNGYKEFDHTLLGRHERDRRKRYRVSKGFCKAANISPPDLGKEITKALPGMIDILKRRADIVFTKMDKVHSSANETIDHDCEFLLETWLDEVKMPEAQAGVFYDSLEFTP